MNWKNSEYTSVKTLKNSCINELSCLKTEIVLQKRTVYVKRAVQTVIITPESVNIKQIYKFSNYLKNNNFYFSTIIGWSKMGRAPILLLFFYSVSWQNTSYWCKSIEIYFPTLLGNYVRQTDLPTNRRRDRVKGSYTSNNEWTHWNINKSKIRKYFMVIKC